MKLFYGPEHGWTELEVRGVTDDAVFFRWPNEWAIYEVDRKELEKRGAAVPHERSAGLVFTEAAKLKEDVDRAHVLANPTDKEFYVWARATDRDGFEHKVKWEKNRVIGWTAHVVFVNCGWESADYPGLGTIAWLDRHELREKGSNWGTHGTFYTEATMLKAKVEDAKRAAEEAKKTAEERRRRWEYWKRTYSFGTSAEQRESDLDLLGITAGVATREQIMKAFRQRAKLYHPDVAGGDGNSSSKWRRRKTDCCGSE